MSEDGTLSPGFIKESLDYSGKQIAMAIVPKAGATLSIIGSVYIIQQILRSSEKRNKVFSRLVLGLSISDVLLSICFFLGTWPAPVGTTGAYMAAGTTQTCTAQGFFSQLTAICTPIYNGSLALYFALVIRYQWTERDLLRIEPFLHALPVAVGIGTSVTGLVLDLYNYSNWICWIAPLPWGCEDSVTFGETNCERGDNAWVFQWAFLYAPVWFLIVFVAVAMFLVYRTVLASENRSSKWTFTAECRRKHSKKVAMQGFLYVLVFLLTWFFATLTRILDLIKKRTYFPIVITMAFFLPCQGFFNALVYLRPRYMRYIEQNPDKGVAAILTRGMNGLTGAVAIARMSSSFRRISRITGSVATPATGSAEISLPIRQPGQEDYFDDEDFCSMPPPVSNDATASSTQPSRDPNNSVASGTFNNREYVATDAAEEQNDAERQKLAEEIQQIRSMLSQKTALEEEVRALKAEKEVQALKAEKRKLVEEASGKLEEEIRALKAEKSMLAGEVQGAKEEAEKWDDENNNHNTNIMKGPAADDDIEHTPDHNPAA